MHYLKKFLIFDFFDLSALMLKSERHENLILINILLFARRKHFLTKIQEEEYFNLDIIYKGFFLNFFFFFFLMKFY